MEFFSPAKINLFLHVTGKRKDGYHDLFTLMCCIGLYDRITLSFDTPGITVSCGHPDVPENECNIAFRAAALFFKALRIEKGVHIDIEKQIPVGAGLGGGSSNAAAVLNALNRYWGNPIGQETLMSMGLSLGADVPFLLSGTPAIATGIGEKLETCTLMRPYHVLVAYPGIHVSTAAVYRNLSLGLTNCGKKIKQPILTESAVDIKHYLCNDLEIVTCAMHPEINHLKKTMMAGGADGALMSGSGSAVFGLFSDRLKAQETFNQLMKHGESYSGWQQHLVEMIL